MTQETIVKTVKQCADNYLISEHHGAIIESCKDALIAAGYKIYRCTLSWDQDPFPYPMDLFEGVKADKDIDDTFEKLYWMQKPALSKDELTKNDYTMKYYETTKQAFRLACHGALEKYGALTCWNVRDEMFMLGQWAHDVEWKGTPYEDKNVSTIHIDEFKINASKELLKEFNDFVAEANTKSSQIIGIELRMILMIMTEIFNHTRMDYTYVSLFDAFEKLRQDKTAVFIETGDYPIADCVKVIKTE